MKKRYPFRTHHLLNFLQNNNFEECPLDLSLSLYFRNNKALGSKDRAFIAETVYGLFRWLGLLDSRGDGTWESRVNIYLSLTGEDFANSDVRLNFPPSFFQRLSACYGEEKAVKLCQVCQIPAPLTLRVNTLKTTRSELLNRWKDKYEVSPTPVSKEGMIFHKRTNFFELPEFRQGLFEIQDEGSQLIASLVEVAPGQQVLDFCAGSGGKTLAFAPKMQQKGQIYLHDIRSGILLQAKKRLRRAGIQNGQVVLSEDPKLKKLKKKMDWVLVDAPCSGTGTWRRNPDMKWKYSDTLLERLVGEQRTIFEKALSFLHPQGYIVYATCSILKEENQDQVAHFLKTYPLQLVKEPLQLLPTLHGMDGFFGAVFKIKGDSHG